MPNYISCDFKEAYSLREVTFEGPLLLMLLTLLLPLFKLLLLQKSLNHACIHALQAKIQRRPIVCATSMLPLCSVS